MRLFTLALCALLLWLQYDLWIGRNGLMEYETVKTHVAEQINTNTKLTQRNQEMYAEINDLQSGLSAVEARARSELGFTKPGETFFRIVGDNANSTAVTPTVVSPTSLASVKPQ